MANKNYLLHTLILASVITGCAKERPFEVAYKITDKGPVTSMSAINTEAEFLYVPTSQGIPRYSKAMSPFVQGTERIIRFKFEKEAIVAYQMEKDAKFADNKLNNKPILKIPVEYKAYKCAENDNKECTNKEVENTELEWFQKDHFVASYGKTEVLESDTLDLPSSSDSCFSHTGDALVDGSLQITKTDINYIIEKSFKYSDSSSCMNQLWYSSNGYFDFLKQLDKTGGTFKTQVSYSFARLDSIASPGYQAVDYPVEEHGIFGFFTTSEEIKTADRRFKNNHKLNRWNPERKVVDYILSDEFNKPENKYLKDASFFAFERMNQALQREGVNLHLNLNAPSGKNPGNLRNTMIVLIEDIASGLLGYGPSVANPRTGEIVKAHTNMYKGSLESFAPYTYDSIVFLEQELMREKNARPQPQEERATRKQKNVEERIKSVSNVFGIMKKLNLDFAQKDSHKSHGHAPMKKENFAGLKLDSKNASSKTFEEVVKESKAQKFETKTAKKLISALKDKNSDFAKFITLNEEKKAYLQKNNVYTADMINFQALGKASVEEINTVKGIREEDGTLKPWVQLSEEAKVELTQILARHAYIPTLVHEIGHNLGLRHNFAGSTDKENFYSDEDRKDLGIKEGSAYSSIMDYSYSQLNELSTLGKYDTAALKFAYNREVEISENKFFKLDRVDPKTKQVVTMPLAKLAGHLKTYKFCTDENAGASLTCNRFDEGTNTVEIMKHFADKYKEDYYARNIKNRSTNFNDTDGTWSYLVGKYYAMTDVRQIHEQWQGVFSWSRKTEGFENLAVTGCTPEQAAQYADYCSYVKEINEANSLAGRYFIDILKTPDLTCDVRLTSKLGDEVLLPGIALPVVFSDVIREMTFPLENGQGNYIAHSCFDKNAKAQLARTMIQNYTGGVVNHCKTASETPENCENVEITVDVVGESGKLHNDVDSAGRKGYTNTVGDLEIRGNAIDKMLATWFLTDKSLMTVAGGNNNVSFVDSPEFAGEIDNLMRHLIYGEDLQDQKLFMAENGMEYVGPLKVDLNAQTEVIRLKYTLNDLFGTPDSSEGYKIGPVLVKNARNASYVSRLNSATEEDFIDANLFLESTYVYSTSLDFGSDFFGKNIVEKYSTKKYAYGATEENTIALEIIKRLNGEQEVIQTKIAEILKRIDEASPLSVEDLAANKQPASQIALAKMISVREEYNTSKSDVDSIYAILASGQDISAPLKNLSKKIGVLRFDEAVRIFQNLGEFKKGTPELELMDIGLLDLRYTQFKAKEKAEFKANLVNALFKIK